MVALSADFITLHAELRMMIHTQDTESGKCGRHLLWRDADFENPHVVEEKEKGIITNEWREDKKEKISLKSFSVMWIFNANGISNELKLSSETSTVFHQPSIKIYITNDL